MTLTSKGGTTYTGSNLIKPNTHTGTVNALFDDYLKQKVSNTKERHPIEELGRGIRRHIRGRGLSKREKNSASNRWRIFETETIQTVGAIFDKPR
jgi:hypothetical protein